MTWYLRRGSKYGAKRQEYDGRTYHSKKEAGYAAELDILKKAGDVLMWEPQFKVSLDVNGYHITNYFVDFKVWYKDGTIELVEIKGFETEVWRLKRKLMEAVYLKENPEIKYVVVK